MAKQHAGSTRRLVCSCLSMCLLLQLSAASAQGDAVMMGEEPTRKPGPPGERCESAWEALQTLLPDMQSVVDACAIIYMHGCLACVACAGS